MSLTDPHLPPPTSLRWLIPAFAQCLLLHPRFPDSLSRHGRLALCPLSLLLARQAAADGFGPRDATRALNTVWAFLCVYGAWKSVEWAVCDRAEYEWTGFGKGASAAAGDKGERTDPRSQDSWLKVVVDQLHLFTSFRMMGYRAYRGPLPPHRHSLAGFILRKLVQLAVCHLTILACIAWLSTIQDFQKALLLLLRPMFDFHLRSLERLEIARATVSWLALGFFVMAALSLLQSIFALAHLTLRLGNRILGRPLPLAAEFDSRDWAPLFYRPLFPTSVQALWSRHWHQLLRRPFQVGSGIVYNLVLGATGGRVVLARAAGLATVAGMTAFIHYYPLLAALDVWQLPKAGEGVRAQYGAQLFFGWMALLSVVEKVFTTCTGRRVRGVGGYLWAGVTVIPAIVYLLPVTWSHLDLARGLPGPGSWNWQRVMVPLAAAAPSPLWTIAWPEGGRTAQGAQEMQETVAVLLDAYTAAVSK